MECRLMPEIESTSQIYETDNLQEAGVEQLFEVLHNHNQPDVPLSHGQLTKIWRLGNLHSASRLGQPCKFLQAKETRAVQPPPAPLCYSARSRYGQ
jgi:hypothetical protein